MYDDDDDDDRVMVMYLFVSFVFGSRFLLLRIKRSRASNGKLKVDLFISHSCFRHV